MGSTKLKEDLKNCLINFDRKVLITQLLDDYKVEHKEADKIVADFVQEQEKKQKLKYEKFYVVHGEQQKEDKQIKEIYKIVEEAKLKEWLKKLKNAQSLLYAVEIAGGAKTPAAIFKPMSVEEGVKLKQRAGTKAAATNGITTSENKPTTSKPPEKKEIKQEVKKPANDVSNKNSAPDTKKSTQKTPTKSPTTTTKANKKGGINSFFSSAAKKTEDSKDTKAPASGVVKPPTPKKMQDFFKKQTEKPKPAVEAIKKPTANTSVQLFDDDDEDEENKNESSDEEEKLEALKRDIISSDVEMNADDDDGDEAAKPSTSKRRRIIDSDDDDEIEEQPAVKQEKLDASAVQDDEEEANVSKSETFLDEDGFVITKKPKQKAQPAKKKSPPAASVKASPVKKTSPSESKKTSPKSGKGAATTKGKQSNIMSFFGKK
ncbi:DNA polymerase delta subunit 3-like [Musca domestica]|uniref:DNA polymerase delta subunit 3 n=1 Tax=Musca domestica TaxID=7370 RepID=A0ABM3V8E5_MUSDO|nr:DNA polymerase delta subunit 3-like [Musca domestica]